MTVNRTRGRALQATRERLLRASPLCARCTKQGRVTPAVEVDHIVPLYKGGHDTDDNKQNLCMPCHKDKTREDRGLKARRTIGLAGWPV